MSAKETYLSDAEFAQVLGMTKARGGVLRKCTALDRR